MRYVLVWTAAAGLICTACNSPDPRLNAPPHGVAERTSAMRTMYTHMIDNALLANMTVCDIHFLPHRAMLSPLGEERLSRLASLMQAYGGVIRFDTEVEDDELTEQRITTIVDFLREAGIDTMTEVVRRDLPGGRKMDATEAILIKANEATYQPSGSSSSSSSGLSRD